jgi:hypothetical protein
MGLQIIARALFVSTLIFAPAPCARRISGSLLSAQ